MRGGLDVTFGLDESGLVATLKDSGDLTAEGQPVDYTGHAAIVFAGSERDVDLHADWTAPLDGPEVAYTSDLDMKVDAATWCVEISGTASGTVDGRGIDARIDRYEVCPLHGPVGGTVTAKGKTSGSRSSSSSTAATRRS